jgi:hypothetical protein
MATNPDPMALPGEAPEWDAVDDFITEEELDARVERRIAYEEEMMWREDMGVGGWPIIP